MKDVTIVIASKAKQGKSSVAKLIAEFLKTKGVQVRLFDHIHDEDDALENKPAIDKTDEGIQCLIKVVTTTRSLDLIES